jgi:hypothetical protein
MWSEMGRSVQNRKNTQVHDFTAKRSQHPPFSNPTFLHIGTHRLPPRPPVSYSDAFLMRTSDSASLKKSWQVPRTQMRFRKMKEVSGLMMAIEHMLLKTTHVLTTRSPSGKAGGQHPSPAQPRRNWEPHIILSPGLSFQGRLCLDPERPLP